MNSLTFYVSDSIDFITCQAEFVVSGNAQRDLRQLRFRIVARDFGATVGANFGANSFAIDLRLEEIGSALGRDFGRGLRDWAREKYARRRHEKLQPDWLSLAAPEFDLMLRGSASVCNNMSNRT